MNATFPVNTSNTTTAQDRVAIDGWFGFTSALGICGTGFLLLFLTVSTVNAKLRKGTGLLIVHLTALQLYLCAVSFTLANTDAYRALVPEIPDLNLHCPSFMFSHMTAIQAESWASLLLACNRYVAVAVPHRYKEILSKKVVAGMMILPWIIAVAINLPVCFGIGWEFLIDYPLHYCLAVPVDGHVYAAVWPVLGRYLPIVLMGVAYCALFLHTGMRNGVRRRLVDPVTTSSEAAVKAEVRTVKARARHMTLAKITAVSFLWHCLCFLPGPISQSAFPELYSSFLMAQFWLLRTLDLCGYAANPVFYLALSADYQQATARLLRVTPA
ncbi:hypothetical protein BV898_15392 [Hypsibius exemplaris]|uniref:G-protein coupled receptors family 1 profile domain-containing protein n=1 Tax=Hypsibius exemplaris TaxID=2072580 RepID=A0A9X6NK52_HYPEX|nr:hypothetical protein BV898_15392 [Hypsibius exemplaris]